LRQARDIEVLGIITNDPLVFEACLEGRVFSDGEAFYAVVKSWMICWQETEVQIRRRTCA